jgi:uncharacterized protein (TIGR03067 family)
MRRTMLLLVGLLLGAPAVGQDSLQKDLKRFTGTWKVQSVTMNGRELPRTEMSQYDQVVYDGDGSCQQRSEGQTICTAVITAIDTAAKHKAIDYKIVMGGTDKGKTIRAIYEFVDENTYQVCYPRPGGDRPTEFSCKEGSGHTVCLLKRDKE